MNRPAPVMPPPLDVVAALARAGRLLLAELPALLMAGLVLVMLPAVAARAFALEGDWPTLVTTLRALAAMIFVAMASTGALARAQGRALAVPLFVREGLARATPGVQVALLAGCAVMLGLILQLFAQHGTLAGWALDALLLTAGLWALSVALPAVPVAVAEALPPRAALARAAALTAGNRNRVLVVVLITGLALAPAAALVAGLGGGLALWLAAALEWLAWSVAAVVPAAVYVGLVPWNS